MAIVLQGADHLYVQLRKLGPKFVEKAAEIAGETADAIRAGASSRSPRFTGQLSAAFSTSVRVDASLQFGFVAKVETDLAYGWPQEMGYYGTTSNSLAKKAGLSLASLKRPPAASPEGYRNRSRAVRANTGHKLPLSPGFISWAHAKGLNPFAVARTVRRWGYRGHHMLRTATDDNTRDFINRVEELVLNAGDLV